MVMQGKMAVLGSELYDGRTEFSSAAPAKATTVEMAAQGSQALCLLLLQPGSARRARTCK